MNTFNLKPNKVNVITSTVGQGSTNALCKVAADMNNALFITYETPRSKIYETIIQYSSNKASLKDVTIRQGLIGICELFATINNNNKDLIIIDEPLLSSKHTNTIIKTLMVIADELQKTILINIRKNRNECSQIYDKLPMQDFTKFGNVYSIWSEPQKSGKFVHAELIWDGETSNIEHKHFGYNMQIPNFGAE